MNKEVIVPGMKFKVIHDKDPDYSGLYDSSPYKAPTNHYSAPGDIVETTSFVYFPDRSAGWIDFVNTRTKQSSTCNWGSFKISTEYIGGAAPKSLPPITITSSGKFNGFDLSVANSEITDPRTSLLQINIRFEGTFTGTKKINKKMMLGAKKSPGFEAAIHNLLSAEISKEAYLGSFKEFISDGGTIDRYIDYLDGCALYEKGDLAFHFVLQKDLPTTLNNMEIFLKAWMKRNQIDYSHDYS